MCTTTWSREEVKATKLMQNKFRAATFECNAGQCEIELLVTLFHKSFMFPAVFTIFIVVLSILIITVTTVIIIISLPLLCTACTSLINKK